LPTLAKWLLRLAKRCSVRLLTAVWKDTLRQDGKKALHVGVFVAEPLRAIFLSQ
jgi:hypothetical protein